MSSQTLKHPTAGLPSREYETLNEDASSCSASISSQSFDPIAERRRIHELYATQYQQEGESGSLRLGYLPLLAEPHRSPAMEAAPTFWGCQSEQSQSNRAPSQRLGSLKFTSRPLSAACTISSPETISQTPEASQESSLQLRTEFDTSTLLRGSMLFGSLEPQSSLTQDQGRFPNLDSPWTMRQPGIPAAGPSASGNVSTRLALTRVSGNQQVAAGTASNVAPSGNNGLMVANTETFFSNGLPLSHSSNDSVCSAPSLQESSFESNMLGSSLGEYYQFPSKTIGQQRNSTSCSTPRYSADSNSSSDRNQSRTPSKFVSGNGITTTSSELIAADREPSNHSSAKLDSSGHLRSGKILDQSTVRYGETLCTPSLPYLTSSGPSLYGDYSASTMNTAFPSTANLDDPFYDRCFNSRRSLHDGLLSVDSLEDQWASFGLVEPRKFDGNKIPDRTDFVGKNERHDHWNDTIESLVGHGQTKMTAPSSVPTIHGIDHYHGSPQQTSRSRILASSRPQLFHGAPGSYSSTGYYQQANRPHHQSSSQRCSSCYATKLELEQTKLHLEQTRQRLELTKQQLVQCTKERDRCFKSAMQLQRKFQENDSQKQRLHDKPKHQSSPKRPADSSEMIDTATRLQRFYQRYLQHVESQYQRGSPEASVTKDDQYFQSEFAMLFTSSVKSWADRYFKFPQQEPIPRELEQALKCFFPRDDYVESLITSEKTKSFVVQGLVSRFIVWEIFNADFQRSFQSLDEKAAEEEAGKRCNKICKDVHDLIHTLISRLHERGVAEASERSLQNIFEHAGRLSLAMARAGGDKAWFIDFPKTHEQFKAELMHDAEQYFKNIDSQSLERERALIKMAAMPLVVRIQQRKQHSVIFKAQVLLRPFTY